MDELIGRQFGREFHLHTINLGLSVIIKNIGYLYVGYGVTANIAASHLQSVAAARGSIPRTRMFFANHSPRAFFVLLNSLYLDSRTANLHFMAQAGCWGILTHPWMSTYSAHPIIILGHGPRWSIP